MTENILFHLVIVAGFTVFCALSIYQSRQIKRRKWLHLENPEIQRQIAKINADIEAAKQKHRARSNMYSKAKSLRHYALAKELNNG